MTYRAGYWIEKLGLEKHPEGGWFKEVYRSADIVQTPSGDRSAGTSIYYLLENNDFSALHRIKSDEIWHYYAGNSAIEIIWIEKNMLKSVKIGKDFDFGECFQFVVPKNSWFAARLVNNTGFALVGCSVSPGFDFSDFELANEKVVEQFSEISSELLSLIRK